MSFLGHGDLAARANRSVACSIAATIRGVACVLGAVSCISNEQFDPSGGDVSLQASWTVAGQAASEEVCAEAGVERVLLEFQEGDWQYIYAFADCRCAAGGFDARVPDRDNGCSEARLSYGIYDVAWVFLDRKRSEVARSARFVIDASEGGPCVVPREDPSDAGEDPTGDDTTDPEANEDEERDHHCALDAFSINVD